MGTVSWCLMCLVLFIVFRCVYAAFSSTPDFWLAIREIFFIKKNEDVSPNTPLDETSPSERIFHLFAVSRYTKQFRWREELWTLQLGDGTPSSIYIAINAHGSREEFHPYTFVKPVGIIMLPHSLWQAKTKEQIECQRTN